jgi:hypothetical protein
LNFTHAFFPRDAIYNEDTESGRYYILPDGSRYPSVTTVIGRYMGDEGLEKWRKSVGEDNARRVTIQAGRRGRFVHDLAEKFLMNDPGWQEVVKKAMPANVFTFNQIKPILVEKVGRVFGVEFPLWSHVLRTAGRSDLICEWEGVPAVVDFKTSRRVKTEPEIWNYLVQKSTYARMFEERTGLSISRVVTVMVADHHDEPLMWVRERAAYDEDVDRVFLDRLPDPGMRLSKAA